MKVMEKIQWLNKKTFYFFYESDKMYKYKCYNSMVMKYVGIYYM